MTEHDEEMKKTHEASDFRPHWEGSTLQQWRTRLLVMIAFLAFFIYILYEFGPTIIPPGS